MLLINDFQWKPAPIATPVCEDGTASLISIDFSTEYYDQKLIDFVEKDNHLAFASYYIDEENLRINKLMNVDDIKTGLFIPEVKDRKAFMDARQKRDFVEENYTTSGSEDEEGIPKACTCRRGAFRMCDCVCVQFPIKMAHDDRQVIFQQAISRMDDTEVLANTFDDLHPAKKRWCMYWWYAVNILSLSAECKKLPNCFVDMVRKQYPNPKGEFFVGFKSKADRMEPSYRRKNSNSSNKKQALEERTNH
jgi:hypothetical protein